MSTKIYFDMDGVLADFDLAAIPFSQGRTDLNNQGKLMTRDALDAKKSRWQRIEEARDFWANIPVMKSIEKMLDAAQNYGELFVLTSVPSAKNFVAGTLYVDFIESEKRAWVARYLSKYFTPKNVIVTRIAKERLIHPTQNDILIDDRVGNVADWMAAGGRGIVFKTPEQTIKDLTLLGL